jgi:hypothetical protein
MPNQPVPDRERERMDAFSHAGLRRKFIHATFLPLIASGTQCGTDRSNGI